MLQFLDRSAEKSADGSIVALLLQYATNFMSKWLFHPYALNKYAFPVLVAP